MGPEIRSQSIGLLFPPFVLRPWGGGESLCSSSFAHFGFHPEQSRCERSSGVEIDRSNTEK